jgi:sugar lactone lactonase YvrE
MIRPRACLALVLALALIPVAGFADCPNLFLATVTGASSGAGSFNNPQHVTCDLAGNVYFADTGSNRILELNSVGSFLHGFGGAGSGNGQLSNPRAVAVDSTGNVYVVDTNNHRIQKFSGTTGFYLAQWGSAGSGNGQFNGAQGIAMDPTNTYVYVAEYTNNRVQKFTTAGAYVTQWASTAATDVACDPSGNVYVSSYTAGHVTEYSSTGAVLATIGTPGTGNGQISGPQGLAIDRYGDLYVADGNNTRIAKFTTTGTWLANFGVSGEGQITNAFGVAVDTAGVVWTTDGTANTITEWAAVPVHLALSASANPVTNGMPYTWTVRATPTGSAGRTQLLDSSNSQLVSFMLVSRQSSLVFGGGGMPAGTHALHLQYLGTAYCTGVASAAVNETFNAGAAPTVCANAYVSRGPSATSSFAHVATDAAGRLYLSDASGIRIVAPDGITVLMSLSPDQGAISSPGAIAVRADGEIAVADANTGNVEMITPYPSPLPDYGVSANFFGYTQATAIAFSPLTNLLYIADSPNAKVIPITGLPSDFLIPVSTPTAIAFEPSGNLVVTSSANGIISRYSPSGGVLGWYGGYGSAQGLTSLPSGIAVDGYNNVYVADAGNNRIDKFDTGGNLVATFGTNGTGDGQFQDAWSVAVDTTGVLWVLDGYNKSVQRFGAVPISGTLAVTPTTFAWPGAGVASVLVQAAPTGSWGTVTLKDNGVSTWTGSLTGGSLSTGPYGVGGIQLHVGPHPLRVAFDGGGTCTGPVTNLVNVNVTAGTLPLVLNPTLVPNPSGTGQVLVFGCALNGYPQGLAISASVQFLLDGSAYGVPVPLNELGRTSTSVLFSGLVPGPHTLGATWAGTSDIAGSTATPIPQTVLPPGSPPAFVGEITSSGAPLGSIADPVGLALDSRGELLVADSLKGVLRFGPTGNFLQSWPAGAAAGIAVDPADRVLVSDLAGGNVKLFSTSGQSLGSWPLAQSHALAADLGGHVFDASSHAINEYLSDGTAVSWSVPADVRTLACDASGWVYSTNTDAYESVLQVAAPGGGASPIVGNVLDGGTITFDSTLAAAGAGRFKSLWGVAVDGLRRLYATDAGANRIEMFANNGAFLAQWPLANGRAGAPGAIVASGYGDVWVADPIDHVIQHFTVPQAITSLADVGNDQGRELRLSFTPHALDNPLTNGITTYEVYRKVVAGYAAQHVGAAAATPAQTELAGWDLVTTLPATGDSLYVLVVPTLADSNATGSHPSTFLVRALTSTPSAYYDSAPFASWSVDNLAPATPSPFTAARASGSTDLHWGRNTEPDFASYRLYRGASAGFTPGPANLVASPVDTGYVDPGAAPSWYALTAVDVNGNESPPARISPSGTTSVGDGAPLAFALERIRPNPVHGGALTIACALPDDAPARVELLDVSGRVVQVRTFTGAGQHLLAFETSARPGLYWIRLTQASRTAVRRVAVIE